MRGFFENLFAKSTSLGNKIALLLNLTLDFSLLQIYVLLFAFEMFGLTFFPWLEPLAQLFRLSAHRLWLEGTS